MAECADALCESQVARCDEDDEVTYPRQLTEEEQVALAKDTRVVSDFRRQKFELEAKKHWDLFYKRNQTKFFKDRHWTSREFNELAKENDGGTGRRVILEVGCGVGNFFYPLLEDGLNFFVHACDLSPRAIEFVKEHSLYSPENINAFPCDVTKEELSAHVAENSVDIATLIFVLSAMELDSMVIALKKILQVLKPGGLCLLRDYGLYDHAMLRFAPGHKLEENFYVRQDGTRAYYFSLEKLASLFICAGFEVVSNEYVYRETVNRKEGLCVPRIFVQAKFMRPLAVAE